MVQVKVSETYDLSTEVDKMGIIGIHTPSTLEINKMWSGFFTNYRYFKLVGCDVTLACASMLPADPLQIGVESGEIAPQDMFNPILYTAVSNDSFNTIQNRIYCGLPINQLGSLSKSDLGTIPAGSSYNDFDVYYGLLADPDGWRKAMPQSGLEMKGLYPIVYQMVQNYGDMWDNKTVETIPAIAPPDSSEDSWTKGTLIPSYESATKFRGPSMRMPALPTYVAKFDSVNVEGNVANSLIVRNEFPTTYVACIITPPAKLHKLYYRMKVTWTIEFFDVRPATEFDSIGQIGKAGQIFYATDYVEQSKSMTVTSDMVDANGATVDKVMTSSK